MEEEILPIGIDSTIEHVEAETGRIDGLFSVPTGSIGAQQVNYHLIDEERKRYSLALPPSTDIEPSAPIKRRSSILLNETHANAIWIGSETSQRKEIRTTVRVDDEPMIKAQFSLPESLEKNVLPRRSGRKSETRSTLHDLFKERNNDSRPNLEKSATYSSIIDVPDQCRLPSPRNTYQDRAESCVPFYNLDQLAQHNDQNDAWISLFGLIINLTPFIEKAVGTKIFDQYIHYAGQDLSHLFDDETHQPKSSMPNLSLIESMNLSFWNSTMKPIGQLIKHPRWIRLRYVTFPEQNHLFQVDEEETLGQIALKMLPFNRHIFSYRWRYDSRTLDLNKTLTENGLINEEHFHDQYGWRSDEENCSTIILDYIDDLSIG